MRATLGWASVCTPAPFSAIGVHERYGGGWTASIPDSMRLPVIMDTMDDLDRQILALLVEDGRRTYDDIGRRVSLSAPSVKRRVDRLGGGGGGEGGTGGAVDRGARGVHGGGRPRGDGVEHGGARTAVLPAGDAAGRGGGGPA